MIDSVRAAVLALEARGRPVRDELSVLQLDDAPGIFVGLDRTGHPHLLLELDAADSFEGVDPGVVTIEVGSRMLRIGDRDSRFLDVHCLFESVAEVFDHFVVGVIEKTVGGMPPVGALKDVLERWRQFLTPAKGPVGRDKLAAVFGELLVLIDAGEVNATKAVASWLGPFGGRHDFRRGATALEVKTTRSHTSRQITIHGEDQLAPPENGSLHLHFVRVEEVPDGDRSVASLADELLSAGVSAEELFAALERAGVPAAELAATGDVTFEVRERLTVPIDADSPRIVPASFMGGARPVGVIDLSYVVDLDHSLSRALDDEDYALLIARLVA